jgi:hypothetical protein
MESLLIFSPVVGVQRRVGDRGEPFRHPEMQAAPVIPSGKALAPSGWRGIKCLIPGAEIPGVPGEPVPAPLDDEIHLRVMLARGILLDESAPFLMGNPGLEVPGSLPGGSGHHISRSCSRMLSLDDPEA